MPGPRPAPGKEVKDTSDVDVDPAVRERAHTCSASLTNVQAATWGPQVTAAVARTLAPWRQAQAVPGVLPSGELFGPVPQHTPLGPGGVGSGSRLPRLSLSFKNAAHFPLGARSLSRDLAPTGPLKPPAADTRTAARQLSQPGGRSMRKGMKKKRLWEKPRCPVFAWWCGTARDTSAPGTYTRSLYRLWGHLDLLPSQPPWPNAGPVATSTGGASCTPSSPGLPSGTSTGSRAEKTQRTSCPQRRASRAGGQQPPHQQEVQGPLPPPPPEIQPQRCDCYHSTASGLGPAGVQRLHTPSQPASVTAP